MRENISDAQIQSQIDVLNEDFHKLNSDCQQSAQRLRQPGRRCGHPVRAGQAHTRRPGHHRHRAQKQHHHLAGAQPIKSRKPAPAASTPGTLSQYLNLWVGTIGGGILGYAQFPGGAAATDGVVISPVYFGRTGTVTAPYNLGRTASHEVGHWLNLNHIWGDDNGACTGTDNVADTPNQGAENYGKPTFPHVSCSQRPERRHVHELHGLCGRQRHVHVLDRPEHAHECAVWQRRRPRGPAHVARRHGARRRRRHAAPHRYLLHQQRHQRGL